MNNNKIILIIREKHMAAPFNAPRFVFIARPNMHPMRRVALKPCKYCRAAPRNPGFEFCSSTCGRAYRRARLCKFCKAKPANAGFEFCGRTCGRAYQQAKLCIRCRTHSRHPYYGHFCGPVCATIV